MSLTAANVSIFESGATPGSLQVAAELAAHEVAGLERRDGLQHLHLLVADRLAVGAHRRLHREVAQHLEQVVLHDVADRARLVVELAAALDAEVLGHRDLHALDVTCGSRSARGTHWRSGRTACCAPAACRGNGRCGRCATSSKVLSRIAFSLRADSRSWPNGFSTMTRAPAAQFALRELLDDGAEQDRRNRQVVRRPLRVLRAPCAAR